jgi:hypothetical protein
MAGQCLQIAAAVITQPAVVEKDPFGVDPGIHHILP